MGFDLPLSITGRDLQQAVARARTRLNSVEEKHEHLFRQRSPEIRGAGLEYANAVHQYSSAVMAWLAWLAKHGDIVRLPGQEPINEATDLS